MSSVQRGPTLLRNGLTYGDLVRHRIIRETLENELFHSPVVDDLFRRWAAQLGYPESIKRFREARLRFAREQTEVAAQEEEAAWSDIMQIVRRAFQMKREAEDFVSKLEWQSSWLARDLRNGFAFWLWQGGTRAIPIPRKSLLPNDAPAPRLKFSTKGLMILKSLKRLEDLSSELKAELLPQGRVPKNRAPSEKIGRWFYRYRVKVPGDSYRAIAREVYHDADRHNDVSRGVERAEELLNLIP